MLATNQNAIEDKKTQKITWNDERVLSLFKCVISAGAHVREWGKTDETWECLPSPRFRQSFPILERELQQKLHTPR
jgi:hypothetical protein